MRVVNFYILFFLPIISSAQLLNNSCLFYLDSAKQVLNLQGQGYIGSSHMPLEFIRLFYDGGFIDDNTIQTLSSNLNGLNRTGLESSANLSYINYNPLVAKKYGYYVNVSTLFSGGVEYTNDVFRSIFQGNSSYKGERINLQQSGLHLRSYRSFEGGIINKKFKVGLCYSSIQTEINSQIYNGGIDVSTNATDLTGNLNGYYTRSNPSSSPLNKNWGLTLNFEIINKINSSDSSSNAKIIAGINGLGIQHLSNCRNLYLDTSFNYSGVAIFDLSDLDSPSITNLNIDSLSSISNQINAFPFELYVHKIGGKKEAKFHSCYGLRYRSSSNYNILLYAGGEYHIKKSFTIGSIVSFGGYSGFNHGFYFRHQSKKFISAIGTNNLIGLFWNQSNATGINLSLSYIIE
tara:strand:- start:629 stop:1840 length:1212 start_codon:yes stop_codon:yes gene_type:complete